MRININSYTLVETILILMLVGLLGVIGYEAYYDIFVWPNYFKEHSCKATGNKTTSTYLNPIYSGNNVVTYIPQEVTTYEYACDNGNVWR